MAFIDSGPKICLTVENSSFSLRESESWAHVSGTSCYFPCRTSLFWSLNVFSSTSILLTGDFCLCDLNVSNKGLATLMLHPYKKEI